MGRSRANPNHAGSVGTLRPLTNRASGDDPLRRDLGEWNKNECTLAYARMRKNKVGLFQNKPVIIQNVDVERPGPPARAGLPAELPFESLGQREQRAGGQGRLGKRTEVDEVRLRDRAPGGRAVE